MDIQKLIEDQKEIVEEIYQMGGLSSGLYGDYASDVAKRTLLKFIDSEIERKKGMITKQDEEDFECDYDDQIEAYEEKGRNQALSEDITHLEALKEVIKK